MDKSNDTKEHLELVAGNTLETFDVIANEANARLSERPTSPEDVLVDMHALTSSNAIGMLNRIMDENKRSLINLTQEPAIARVVATKHETQVQTYFICRTSPVPLPDGEPHLASYRSPVGRLASLPVGEEIQLPNGEVLQVTERAILRPVRDEQEWDSKDSVLQGETYGPLTVKSLRTLLAKAPADEIDDRVLDTLLEEEPDSANVGEGIRRAFLTRMQLRDQPVLDKFQDEIFRLPLNSRLLLLGSPGTGKTTALIRRLGQKLDIEFLGEEEQLLIQRLGASNVMPHATSWLMFTPTSLLQQYVKEAFSREGVPASDRHVRTWTDYRREVARNDFGLLRTPTSRGGFVLQQSAEYLGDETLNNLTGWFDDFEAWQQSAYVERLRSAAEELATSGEVRIVELGAGLVALLESSVAGDIGRLLRGLSRNATEAREIAAELRTTIDLTIRRALVLQVNRNRNFLDELAAFLDTLNDLAERPVNEDDVREDESDEDEDDEEEGETPRTGRRGAQAAYRRALRAQARAMASGRGLRSTSSAARIIDWLGDRGLAAEEQMAVGRRILVHAKVRTFVNPAKLYFDGVSTRYRNYRRARQSEEHWYLGGVIRRTDIHELELDMLLLSILRGAKALLTHIDILRDLQNSFWATLLPVQELCRNQIFADEATDFSPVQLACMSALSHSVTNSFFACGDFNQRLSARGARSVNEVAWAVPGIGIERVTIGYRQSRQLNEFTRQIVRIGGGEDYDVIPPPHASQEGVPPVLAVNLKGYTDAGMWLADRVTEIEKFVGQLPSIAILVPEEEQVVPIAKALGEVLAEQNINVVACPNGQVIGQDNDVRVFDVQHIKGLEFEAVFFKDVDRLAEVYPSLFDKFLYVGATRAATYLGLTCSGLLPAAISDLGPMFSPAWRR